MVKNYSIIVILSLIMISTLIYAIGESGSPWDSRGKKFDQTRVTDLNNIKYLVDDYYSAHQSLPSTIGDLKTSNTSTYYKLTDPETGKDYEYKTTGQTSYQLCATFAQPTDTKDNNNLVIPSLSGSVGSHPKGHYCYDLAVSSSYLYKTPTVNPPSYSSNYRITGPGVSSGSAQLEKIINDPKISSVATDANIILEVATNGINPPNFPLGFFNANDQEWGLISLPEGKSTTVTIKFKNPVKLASISNLFTNCTVTSCFNWLAVGTTDSNSTINLVNTTYADQNVVSKQPINLDQQFKELKITANQQNDPKKVGYQYFYWKKITLEYK
jgi:hypothetical protein